MVQMVAQHPNLNALPEQLWTSLREVNFIPVGSIGERTEKGIITVGSKGETTTQFGKEFTPNEIEIIKKTPFLASAIETAFYEMSPLWYRDLYKNRLEYVEARRYYNFAQRDYVGFLKSQVPYYIVSGDTQAASQLFQTLYDYGVKPEELNQLYNDSLIKIQNDVADRNQRIAAASKGPGGLGGFLTKYIVPIATVAGAIAGGPMGAAIGNSLAQLGSTGKIDPVQVAIATGTVYVAGGGGGTLSTAQQIAAGATLGAAGAAATGGDPLKGAVRGAVSSITSTTYAQSVGNALGITSQAAAQTVGNAIINAGLSGIQAAVTPGANVEKSILGGAITGAVMVNASEFATAVLGENTIKEIEKLTNLTEKDVGNIFSNSVVQSVIANINNQDAGRAFINTAISNGVSQSVANSMWNGLQDSFRGREDVLAGIVTAVQGVANTGVNAALYNQNISQAIENAAPGIIVSSFQAYNVTADELQKRKKAEEERQRTALEFTDLPTLLAGPVSQEALAQTQARNLFGEVIVGQQAENIPGIGNIVRRTIQGTRNDGTPYSYDITIYEDGSVTYSYLTNQGSIVSDRRPNLKNSVAGIGDIPIEQAGQKLPLTGLIDLRSFIATSLPTGSVVFSKNAGGGASEKSSSGFQFIGKDSFNRDRFNIGGTNFTVIALDGKNVLVNDNFKVILVPILNQQTGQPELRPTSESEPFNPPQQDPVSTPESIPEPISNAEMIRQIEQQLDAELQAIREGRTERFELARGVRTEREQAQYEREQAQFENDLKKLEADIAKAKSDEEKAQARQIFTTQQRERLRETGRLTSGLQAQIDAELGNLLNQYEDAQRRAGLAATQKEGLVAPQQPKDTAREISDQDVIDLLGLDRDTAERYGFFGEVGGVRGGLGPDAGVDGGDLGAGLKGAEPGAEEEGAGVGEEGVDTGTEEDVRTRLRPIVIYDQRTGAPRATQGIPQRVTAQAVEGILGDKEPLFGGDEDEQRAIWNRRSLRLRKALGL